MSAACSILTPSGRVQIGPAQARNLAARARAMRRDGKTDAEIAATLNISAGSISAVLRVATHLGAPSAPKANAPAGEAAKPARVAAPLRRAEPREAPMPKERPARDPGISHAERERAAPSRRDRVRDEPDGPDYPEKAVRRLKDFGCILSCGGEWLSIDRQTREEVRTALGEVIAYAAAASQGGEA